jgi:ATP-dependent protease ClpP protease subunit
MERTPEMRQALEQARSRYAEFQKFRRAFHPGARSWYSMQAEGETAEVRIYDAIGMFGVEASQFCDDLEKITAGKINLRINSPGGDVFDGTAIYNALLRHPAQVHVSIDGVAASMASIIALAGDTVEMAESAFYMIHKPWSWVVGTADDMRKEAVVLDKITGTAAGIYANNSELSLADVEEAMAEETWYTAQEAKDAGFIDTIFTGEDGDAKASFDLTVFSHAPEGLASGRSAGAISPKGVEKALRDAGLTQAQAKAVMACGYKGVSEQRDADPDYTPALRSMEQLTQRMNAAATS